jgi:hypothetical protein
MSIATREGIRSFVRRWTGGVDEQCRFRVLPGGLKSPAKVDENLIEVGALWMRRNGMPAAALLDEQEVIGA